MKTREEKLRSIRSQRLARLAGYRASLKDGRYTPPAERPHIRAKLRRMKRLIKSSPSA